MKGKRTVCFWIATLTAGLVIPIVAAEELCPFAGRYELTSGSMTVGEMELSLALPGNGEYHYRSRSRPTGLLGLLVGGRIEEQSSGELSAGELRPLRYRYRREGDKARVVALDFDWRRRRVVNTINDDPWTMTIEPDTVDKLAVQLALMRDLQSGESEMTYRVADGGKLKTYRFRRGDEEVVETPVGRLKSVRVRRDRDREDRYTEFWCAPRFGFLPVRVIQYRDGEEHARMDLQQIDHPAE